MVYYLIGALISLIIYVLAWMVFILYHWSPISLKGLGKRIIEVIDEDPDIVGLFFGYGALVFFAWPVPIIAIGVVGVVAILVGVLYLPALGLSKLLHLVIPKK